MNRAHTWLCRSERWAGRVKNQLLPWALDGIPLGDELLEIGPGYGATTRLLVERTASLTALEIDPDLAERLRGIVQDRARIIVGDGASMPMANETFSSVVCFTMLHHVPSPALQDRLFAEAFRVLRPGGVFAGSDSVPSLMFRLLHIGDTMVLVDPATAARRLEAAGFVDVAIDVGTRAFKFRARKP